MRKKTRNLKNLKGNAIFYLGTQNGQQKMYENQSTDSDSDTDDDDASGYESGSKEGDGMSDQNDSLTDSSSSHSDSISNSSVKQSHSIKRLSGSSIITAPVRPSPHAFFVATEATPNTKLINDIHLDDSVSISTSSISTTDLSVSENLSFSSQSTNSRSRSSKRPKNTIQPTKTSRAQRIIKPRSTNSLVSSFPFVLAKDSDFNEDKLSMGNSEIEKPSRNKNKKTNVDNKKLDKERRKKKSTSLGFHPTSMEYPKRDFQLALFENICVCDYLEFVELEDSDFWLTLIRKKYPNFQYGPVHLKFLNTFVKRYNLTTFPLHYGLQNITKITKRKTKPLEHHYLPKIYHDFFIESFYDQFIKYSDDWKYYSVTEMERMMARGCSTIPYINDRLLLKWTLGSGIVLIRWLDMIHKIYPGYESMVTREFLELVKEGVYRYLFTCTSSLEIFMDTCIKVIANQPVELFIPEILHSHFSKWFTISCFSLKNMNQSHLYIQNPLEMNYNSTPIPLFLENNYFCTSDSSMIDQRAILDTSSVTLHDSSVTTHSIEMDMFGTNIQPPEIDIHTNDLIPQEPNLIFPSLSDIPIYPVFDGMNTSKPSQSNEFQFKKSQIDDVELILEEVDAHTLDSFW